MTTLDFIWQAAVILAFGAGGAALCRARFKSQSDVSFQLLLSQTRHLYLASPLLLALPFTNVYLGIGMVKSLICDALTARGVLAETPSPYKEAPGVLGNRQIMAVGNQALGFFLVTNKFSGMDTILEELGSL